MARTFVCIYPLAVAALVSMAPGQASAQSSAAGRSAPAAQPATSKESEQRARDLFSLALRDENGKDYAAALTKLQAAAILYETPGLRFHIAFCREKLGQLSAALHDYEQARDEATRAGKQDVLAQVNGPLVALSKRVPRVILRVQTQLPPHANVHVSLDLRHLEGAIGTELTVEPGHHSVVAQVDGYEPLTLDFDASEGTTVTYPLTFVPSAGAGKATAPQPAAVAPAGNDGTSASPTNSEGAAGKSTVASSSGTPSPRSKSSLAPWIFAGAGVVVGGAGVGALLLAGSKAQAATDQCAAVPSWQTCNASGDRTNVRRLDAAALGAFVGSAALLTTALVLATTGTSESPQIAGLQVHAGPTGVAVSGSF